MLIPRLKGLKALDQTSLLCVGLNTENVRFEFMFS